MAFSTGSDDRGPVSEINITPFVDVMLVLLVIFMITAPMMESGIPIQLPKASAKALAKDEAPVTLSLTRDARVFLNQQEIPGGELRKRVQLFFKSRARKEIFIRADGALAYAAVAQAMAEVKNAGIDKIGLVTLPPDKATPEGK